MVLIEKVEKKNLGGVFYDSMQIYILFWYCWIYDRYQCFNLSQNFYCIGCFFLILFDWLDLSFCFGELFFFLFLDVYVVGYQGRVILGDCIENWII